MKKETAIVALVVVAVASFFLGFFVGGRSKIVATASQPAPSTAGTAALGRGGAGPVVGDLYRVPLGRSAWKGARDAKVTIVEFSEFQCPFCRRVGPTLKRIMHEYAGKVKLVFKHNPLNFHQYAMGASQAALAAGRQGKFWQYHDRLFANQQALKRDDLIRYAKEIGLDMARFQKDLDSPAIKAEIRRNQGLARRLGASGTPAFFINGRKLSGAQPYAAFKRIIDQELKRADQALARGVAAAGLYNELTKGGRTKRPAPRRPAGAPANAVYKVPLGNSPTKGPATAKVTIVEFSEFQCPFCRRVLPTLKQLEQQYPGQIRFVFKHNPLPFHKNAMPASEAAMAAADQGKFWQYHDKLFANQRALQPADLERYAREVGLDVGKFKADIASGKYKQRIRRDQAVARQFGSFGTPGFFINGRKLSGAQPLAAFKRIVDQEIKKADAALARGVKATALYAELTKNGLTKAAPRRPRRPAARADKTVYKVPLDRTSACKGPKEALVTVVEFSEFQCPFCNRVLPTVRRLLKDYAGKLRVCFKHNPLPFHRNAVPAALAAIEAHRQGKFWKFHDILFANQRRLGRADLERYAAQAGLDVARVKAAIDQKRGKQVIAAHQRLAAQLGARGTPSFFINGRKLVGARPYPSFKSLVDEVLGQAEAMVKRGVPRSRLYAEIIKKGATRAVAAAPRRGRRNNSRTVYKVQVPKHAPCKGPKYAHVTMVEFSEFQCPFCRRVEPTLKQIEDKYAGKVRICFLHQPLPFHRHARGAAKAAIAAHKQGKFWQYHDKLFANQRALSGPDLERYAVELGLDMNRFKRDMAASSTEATIKADQALGAKFGARGTPTFFINGRKLVGARPFPSFQALIDEEVKKAESLLRKGIPKRRLYQELLKRGVAAATAPLRRPSRPVDNKIYKVAVGSAPVKGSRRAPVTIIEYSDFQCPFCNRVNPTLRRIAQEFRGKVKIAWKNYPLPFHRDAPLAHQAALAAHAQGKFWKYHDKLFANQRALKRPDLERYAQELGLNMDKFKSDLDSGRYKAKVSADMKEAAGFGVRGTPSFFINGRKLVGAQPYARFKALVVAALKGKR